MAEVHTNGNGNGTTHGLPLEHLSLNADDLKESQFLGSIDCGTTSCRFYIFDQFAHVICHHQIEFQQSESFVLTLSVARRVPGPDNICASVHVIFPPVYPEPGWHEHDPKSYLTCLDQCIEACLDQFEELGYDKSMLVGVGIATQRETTLVWDRETGLPLYNAGELLLLCDCTF